MELNELRQRITAAEQRIAGIPRRRLIVYAVIAGLGLIYLAWSFWPRSTPATGFVAAKPAVSAPKIDGPTVTVPLKIVPKKKVQQQFPSANVGGDDTEVIDTADIPNAPNGVTTITTINTQTGEAQTQYQAKEAPWFALERQNYIGLGYGVATGGKTALRGYYKRDLVRVKDIHLQGELAATVRDDRTAEGTAFVNLEWRF